VCQETGLKRQRERIKRWNGSRCEPSRRAERCVFAVAVALRASSRRLLCAGGVSQRDHCYLTGFIGDLDFEASALPETAGIASLRFGEQQFLRMASC
jgi:hypothetical protein